jgi:exodeoxyribonuclease VII large subunit
MSDNGPGTATNIAEFTVSEISGALKRVVEDAFGHVRVRGEISGYRGPHTSGHAYFALKDERARMEAVIWKGTFGRLRFLPEEGMEVVATGKLTTYPGSSKYQIVIDNLEPAGAGALMVLLEERKKRLAAEGLFEPDRKQLLPFMPRVIGVVTSPTGAVIRDILHRIADRFPVHVVVWPVRVQGETTGVEVSAAVAGFNALPAFGPIARPDLIIVARGGGSLEDLWGFNDEAVVRAVAASEIPVISAVGHETDWTLIDLAADVRAPTPTGAAEMAVPVKADLEAHLAMLGARLSGAARRQLERARQSLRAASRALPTPDTLLAFARRGLDEQSARLPRALRGAIQQKSGQLARQRLSHSLLLRQVSGARKQLLSVAGRLTVEPFRRKLADTTRLLANLDQRRARILTNHMEKKRSRLAELWRLAQSVSHQAVLDRGFALVFDTSGLPVRRRAGIAAGDSLTVQFADGTVGVRAMDGPAAPQSRKPRGGKDGAGQGDLF